MKIAIVSLLSMLAFSGVSHAQLLDDPLYERVQTLELLAARQAMQLETLQQRLMKVEALTSVKATPTEVGCTVVYSSGTYQVESKGHAISEKTPYLSTIVRNYRELVEAGACERGAAASCELNYENGSYKVVGFGGKVMTESTPYQSTALVVLKQMRELGLCK